ncbi:uncharacterized protein LOC144097687 [Amblyomma americanum]
MADAVAAVVSRTQCFPLKHSWFVAYRSYDVDPFFGLTAKCVRFHSTETPDLNVSSSPLKVTKHQNALRVSPTEGAEVEIDLRIDYVDCNTCKILRHPYVSKTACSLMVPEQHVANPHSACHFIYRMLCGSKKVQIYDESCKKHH